ncbi:acyl-CoA synthetase [Microbacterium gorillae]|uniref:acyl-CoA synthetase n=1 Tax=Microbacterium gorillae TaxID=1231063 RepID=UPI000B28FDBB|nr:acyl-CoA synthetase [Microbacterium gorillae]
MPAASTPTYTVRHVALARALFAAIAAIMITFTSDHSAAVGLSVFGGFAIATALVWGLAVWLVYPAGRRTAPILLALISFVAGMVASAPLLRHDVTFFVVVISWAALSGLVELIWGLRERRIDALRPQARDAVTLGVITLVLTAATAVVPVGYDLPYYVKDADQEFSLTGIIIAVGIFGGYAAVIAVYEAISGFSPQRPAAVPAADGVTAADISATHSAALSGKADND